MIHLKARRARPLVAFLFSVAMIAGLARTLSGADEVWEYRGQTMGTTYMVKVIGGDDLDDEAFKVKIDLELRRVNDQMSTYLDSSEITRFNESDSTDWFEVSPEFAEVVAAALEISAKTDGAFDVTVGPLIDAWSFGAAERTNKLPDAETLTGLQQLVGYKKLEVREEPPALRKSVPELSIDLSALAKGHGVDRVVDLLRSMGAENVFVEVGGEVRTAGRKADGPWRVGIQLPDAAGDTVMVAHSMNPDADAGTSMATSGDYRNFFTVDGKRYSHTIDPRSAAPVDHSLASVSVIAKTCMEADAWATALNVVGPDQALDLANEYGLHTFFVSRSSPEDFEMNGTGVLAQYVEPVIQPVAQTSTFSTILTVALLTCGIFAVLLTAMAVGVMFGRKSISGSCGGLASKMNEDGSTSCSLCSSPSNACQELRKQMEQSKSG